MNNTLWRYVVAAMDDDEKPIYIRLDRCWSHSVASAVLFDTAEDAERIAVSAIKRTGSLRWAKTIQVMRVKLEILEAKAVGSA